MGFYFRDRWQVNRRLTLNLGLRWEYYPMVTRDTRGVERYDWTTNQMLIGGMGNTPTDTGVTVSKKLFAPRFGLAYRATGPRWYAPAMGSASIRSRSPSRCAVPIQQSSSNPFRRPIPSPQPAGLLGEFHCRSFRILARESFHCRPPSPHSPSSRTSAAGTYSGSELHHPAGIRAGSEWRRRVMYDIGASG